MWTPPPRWAYGELPRMAAFSDPCAATRGLSSDQFHLGEGSRPATEGLWHLPRPHRGPSSTRNTSGSSPLSLSARRSNRRFAIRGRRRTAPSREPVRTTSVSQSVPDSSRKHLLHYPPPESAPQETTPLLWHLLGSNGWWLACRTEGKRAIHLQRGDRHRTSSLLCLYRATESCCPLHGAHIVLPSSASIMMEAAIPLPDPAAPVRRCTSHPRRCTPPSGA